MPTLKQLLLDGNELTGGLPLSWGAAGAMPLLQTLSMAGNGAGGQLPPTWFNNAQSLPELQVRYDKAGGVFASELMQCLTQAVVDMTPWAHEDTP